MYSLESHQRVHSTCQYFIEKKTLNNTYLPTDLAPWLTLSGSNYQCLYRTNFDDSKDWSLIVYSPNCLLCKVCANDLLHHPSPKVLRLFLCSTQLSMNFVLLIYMYLRLLTIVNYFLLNIAEHEIFSAYKYENADYAQLSWAEHENMWFYNLGTQTEEPVGFASSPTSESMLEVDKDAFRGRVFVSVANHYMFSSRVLHVSHTSLICSFLLFISSPPS